MEDYVGNMHYLLIIYVFLNVKTCQKLERNFKIAATVITEHHAILAENKDSQKYVKNPLVILYYTMKIAEGRVKQWQRLAACNIWPHARSRASFSMCNFRLFGMYSAIL
jgi:hypothetical protein